jgi:thioredoxin-related protein
MLGIVAAVMLAQAAQAALWDDNFEKAQKEAKETGHYVLLNFTGSDWCGWCKKLDAEVFSKKAFKEYAASNLVCVTVDFPSRKPQTNKVKEQNEKLQLLYGVEGYPTIIILNPDGEAIGATGYLPGGPGIFIANLNRMIEKDRANRKPSAPQG